VCSPTSSPVRQPTVVRQQSIVRQLDNERSPATSPVRQHRVRQPSTRAPANSPERRRDRAFYAPVSASSVAVRDTPASTRRPGESHLYAGDDHGDQNVANSYLPHVKLRVFKGDMSLETFLAKFKNCSMYLNWNERDRFFHLSNALEGTVYGGLQPANQLCRRALDAAANDFGERFVDCFLVQFSVPGRSWLVGI